MKDVQGGERWHQSQQDELERRPVEFRGRNTKEGRTYKICYFTLDNTNAVCVCTIRGSRNPSVLKLNLVGRSLGLNGVCYTTRSATFGLPTEHRL